MSADTKAQLVSAAAGLLDEGGCRAVTLRAVAERVGVSHNAPYWHFRDRNALLAAVAEGDFRTLRAAFAEQDGKGDSVSALKAAAGALIDYAERHPARYRLLFSDPELQANDDLHAVAFGSFQAYSALVARAQTCRALPTTDTAELTGLIYATLHGAIDLRLGGRARQEKGLDSVQATVDLLFANLGRAAE